MLHFSQWRCNVFGSTSGQSINETLSIMHTSLAPNIPRERPDFLKVLDGRYRVIYRALIRGRYGLYILAEGFGTSRVDGLPHSPEEIKIHDDTIRINYQTTENRQSIGCLGGLIEFEIVDKGRNADIENILNSRQFQVILTDTFHNDELWDANSDISSASYTRPIGSDIVNVDLRSCVVFEGKTYRAIGDSTTSSAGIKLIRFTATDGMGELSNHLFEPSGTHWTLADLVWEIQKALDSFDINVGINFPYIHSHRHPIRFIDLEYVSPADPITLLSTLQNIASSYYMRIGICGTRLFFDSMEHAFPKRYEVYTLLFPTIEHSPRLVFDFLDDYHAEYLKPDSMLRPRWNYVKADYNKQYFKRRHAVLGEVRFVKRSIFSLLLTRDKQTRAWEHNLPLPPLDRSSIIEAVSGNVIGINNVLPPSRPFDTIIERVPFNIGENSLQVSMVFAIGEPNFSNDDFGVKEVFLEYRERDRPIFREKVLALDNRFISRTTLLNKETTAPFGIISDDGEIRIIIRKDIAIDPLLVVPFFICSAFVGYR